MFSSSSTMLTLNIAALFLLHHRQHFLTLTLFHLKCLVRVALRQPTWLLPRFSSVSSVFFLLFSIYTCTHWDVYIRFVVALTLSCFISQVHYRHSAKVVVMIMVNSVLKAAKCNPFQVFFCFVQIILIFSLCVCWYICTSQALC